VVARAVTCAGLMALAVLTAAAEPSLRLEIDASTVRVNEPFTFTLHMSGDSIGTPLFPETDGLVIDPDPRRRTSGESYSFGFGQGATRQLTRSLTYVAYATKTGAVRLPPISVRIDEKERFTRPVVLRVLKGATKAAPRSPQPGRRRTPQPPREPAGPTEQPRRPPSRARSDITSWDDVAFVRSEVDRREVYEGEPVLVSLQLWCVEQASLRRLAFSPPKTEGFYAITLTEEPLRDRREHGGWGYNVFEFQQLLYPTHPGELTIGPWRWDGSARVRLREHDYSLLTEPIPISVRALPEAPREFSGGVGEFSFEAELSSSHTVQGVPVQLSLTVEGEGNPNATGEVRLPAIADAYISDPEKDLLATGAATFVQTVTHAITPLQAGTMTIPELVLCYFDPQSETYQTIRRGPYEVAVSVSGESSRPVSAGVTLPLPQSGVDVVGEDIRPIEPAPGGLKPARSSGPGAAALALGPMAAYAGLALWVRRRRRLEADVGFARDQRAKSKGRKRLQAVAHAADPSDALYRAVIGFIADKLNVPEAGMTSDDVRGVLDSRGIDGELVSRFLKILCACERARYGAGGLSGDEVRALTHAAGPAMDSLDGALRRAGRGASARGGGS